MAPVWSELARISPHCSVFLTEAWIGTWVAVFGPRLEVSVVVFESAEEPVGVCLLVGSRTRHAMIPVRRTSLNASGEPAADTTYIEFNNLLCRGGWEDAVAGSLAALLVSQKWDELAFDGFMPGPAYDALKRALAEFDLQEVWHPSYHVDLAALRRSGTAYEAALGCNSRRSVRQSLRFYSERAPVQLEPAGDLDTALAMLGELAELSRRRWDRRGRCVVLASPYFLSFHRRLIERCFAQQSVHLLRLAAGRHTIGLLYNLVHNGKVYLYQCGYDYPSNPGPSPGTLTLSRAIQWYLDLGFDDCDFLSGEASYKRSLSTGSRRLVWAVFRKTGLKVRCVDFARVAKRWLLEDRGQNARQRPPEVRRSV